MLTVVIDIGTSSARVLLIDRDGKIEQCWQKKYGLYVLDEKTVLQDPEEIMRYIWEMLECAADWIAEKNYIIECISVTGQRSSVIPMNRDGKAMTKAISWQDTRAYEICLEYQKYWEEIYQITGMKLSPVFSAPKMMLLKRSMPEIYEKAYKIVGVQEYVIWHLTHRFVTDLTIASRTSLLNIQTLQWSERLLELFQIDLEKLCELIPAGGIAGDAIPSIKRLFHVNSELPVVSAGGDQQCAALGLGCFQHGDVEVNSGTGAYVIAVSDTPVLDKKMRVNCNVSGIPGKWIIEGAVLSAGKAVDWLNNEFFGGRTGDFSEFMKACEETPAGANGVIAAATFSGKGTPDWNARVRAAFLKVGFENKKTDLPRALLEGIAAELNDCLQTVEELTQKKADTIHVAGGMTENVIYCQVLSDMFGRKLCKPKVCEATALGAWISAQIFLGNIEKYEEAYEKYACKEGNRYYFPNPENRQLYQEENKLRNYYLDYYRSKR